MDHRFYIGRCALDLHVENCQSLKDKRRVISSLKEKLRNRFNCAVCEYGDLSLWQRTQLGITLCANDRVVLDSVIKSLVDYLNRMHLATIVDFKYEII